MTFEISFVSPLASTFPAELPELVNSNITKLPPCSLLPPTRIISAPPTTYLTNMSTLNSLLDAASIEDETSSPISPTTKESSNPPQTESEWVLKEDPASGIPRMVNEVTGEVKVEIEDEDGNPVQSKQTSVGNSNQQPSPTKVSERSRLRRSMRHHR